MEESFKRSKNERWMVVDLDDDDELNAGATIENADVEAVTAPCTEGATAVAKPEVGPLKPAEGAKAEPKPEVGPLKPAAEATIEAAEEEAVAAPCTSPSGIKSIASCSLPPACARTCSVEWMDDMVS
jgi:hypothetical protein